MVSNPTVDGVFFQVGIAVQDIEAARDELTRALGLEWADVLSRETPFGPAQVCVSKAGPPYLELIQGPGGTPWDASAGPRLDHIGYWTSGVESGKGRLEEAGMPLEADNSPAWTYHRGPSSGVRIELMDLRVQDEFYKRWGLV